MSAYHSFSLHNILYGEICLDFQSLLLGILFLLLFQILLFATIKQILATIVILRKYYIQSRKEK